jgi:prepilin-type N-terminal cleavage/methylation domain-containing protein
MKLRIPNPNPEAGFSLPELLISISILTIMSAAVFTSSISLQKSFRAADDYFSTHVQQVRIIDYLGRDVKRGLSVTTSIDFQSVTIAVPNYIIQAGDPEAVANPALIGAPRTPTIVRVSGGFQVNYGDTLSTVSYAISGQSILRTENGVVTTIAASTDQLVPSTTDVELANTEYTNTTVTFLPVFTLNPINDSRYGTTICETSYLRNRRRA